MAMIRTSLITLAAGMFLALAGAATAEIAFKGGDGTSLTPPSSSLAPRDRPTG
jgi:hypothetical protein